MDLKPGVKVKFKSDTDPNDMVIGEIMEPDDPRFIKRPILPGDICIHWDNGIFATYDEWFVRKNMEVVYGEKKE